MPLFSVIMPLYNHAAFVEAAVRSVLAQTCGEWELIVVNDGSTDGCEKIVEKLAAGQERIRLFHQANAGCSAARAAGLARAAGAWLAYLDSDDVWYPTVLADFQAHFTAHPEVRFLYGYRHRLNPDGSVTELPGQFQDRPTGVVELFQRMYISHLCVCYRKELLAAAGGYDPALRNVDDYDLYLRIAKLCPLHPLGKPTGLRRRHPGCISNASGFSRMTEAEVLRRFVERRGGAELIAPEIVRFRLGRLYHSAARNYFKERCYRQALQAAGMGHRYRRTLRSTAVAVAARCLLPLSRPDAKPAASLSDAPPMPPCG